ncbi:MAG: AAA family ATPase [Mycoplasmataceae bacterium]|nr:AAA family ATPase [Mycoplasmataceae bacterium]
MNNIKIKGRFRKIIYSNKSNFHVLSFKIFPNQVEQKNNLQISENLNSINVISRTLDLDLTLDYEIELNVEIKNNSKYKISYYLVNKEIFVSNEKESLIRYLSSSLFKGISSKTATKLVEQIGLDFINDIQKYEEKIVNVIGSKKTKIILEGINQNNEFNEIYKIFLDKNFSTSIFNIINNQKTQNIKSFLEKNIFDLINDNLDLNFLDLDQIALYFYKDYSLDISNQYLILFETFRLENEGSTINKIENIFLKVNQYRSISIENFKKYLINLYKEEKIIIHQDKESITSKKIFEKEKFIVDQILKISKQKLNSKIDLDNLIILEALDDVQKNAIISALSNSISIITGGPGTGKTLLIDLIIKNLEKLNIKKIELLAPTGKAADQITKRTNRLAKTIHSFLKWNKTEFEINQKNPSNVEVIIIDEFSMIDINLFYALLIACPKLKQIIIVGDKDQLPPIGPGFLLNDFILSKKIPLTVLEKIYRQNEGSLISKNSFLIKDSKLPIFDEKESILINLNSTDDIENIVISVFKKYLENNKDLNEFQILIPMYNFSTGIDNINLLIQNYINRNNEVLFVSNSKKFYKFDKVIQLENEIDKNVFNGEIGKIIDIHLDKNTNQLSSILIEFSNSKIIEYSQSEFNKNIKLAYAISIHKFQGSECLETLLIFSKEHQSMFSKKLFYTAYTRARKKVILISTIDNIKKCLENDKDSIRTCNILKLFNDL